MNKLLFQAALVALIILFFVNNGPHASPSAQQETSEGPTNAAEATFTVAGRVQCAPGKKSTVSPVPLHPVVEVCVAPGDRVKKEQVLVKLDDDEPKADVANKKALLECAKILQKEAERFMKRVKESYEHAAIAEASYFAALTAAHKAVQDEKAAEAALKQSEAELEHYEVVSQVDGIVAWLDVHPGMVSRPGTTIWGEVMDLSEIDVRCDITIEQADLIKVGQSVAVTRSLKKNGTALTGKIAMVGLTVNPANGTVPVLVRVANPDMALRCGEPVQVGFGGKANKGN